MTNFTVHHSDHDSRQASVPFGVRVDPQLFCQYASLENMPKHNVENVYDIKPYELDALISLIDNNSAKYPAVKRRIQEDIEFSTFGRTTWSGNLTVGEDIRHMEAQPFEPYPHRRFIHFLVWLVESLSDGETVNITL